MISRLAGLKTVAVLSCFLALAACSKKNTPDLDAGTGPGVGTARPGSAEDFTQNVGDRVFFLEDKSTLNLCFLYQQYLERMFTSFAPLAWDVQDRVTAEYRAKLAAEGR